LIFETFFFSKKSTEYVDVFENFHKYNIKMKKILAIDDQKDNLLMIKEVVKNNNVDVIVTTEKDWIKLKSITKPPSLNGVDLFILKIEVRVKENGIFYRRLSTLLSG